MTCLTLKQLQERYKTCQENSLCFISLRPYISNWHTEVFHQELGKMVTVDRDRIKY